jgi:hypothetical protein
MVAILDAHRHDPYLAQYCSGTVVAGDRVLTAGHCVFEEKARDIVVLIGRTRLTARNGRRLRVRAISVFGPLVVGAPGNWLQVGIVTGGDSCASRGYYDLYARADRISAFALARHPAVQPDPVARPSVKGRFAVGARVRCARGRWQGSPARFSVRWVRLDRHSRQTIGAGGTHRLSARDLSHRVTCVVTARNRGGMNIVAAPPRRGHQRS